MTYRFPACRIVLTFCLAHVLLAAGAAAQDLYRSQAEFLHAAAMNKQADAAMVHAMANYGKAQAEAAKLYEETREKSAHNDLLESETYYKKRAQYHAYRETHRVNPASPERYAELARQAAPAQLSSWQFDGKTGDLRWPTLFKHAVYDSLRRQIDALLAGRTRDDSGAGSQNCAQTLAAIRDLKTELRDNIRGYTSSDYLAARSFLEAVGLEAQRPLGRPAAETLDRIAER
jgi:hypothetical protein